MAHYGVLPDHWEGDGVISLMFPHRADITEFVRGTSASVVDLTNDVKLDVPRVLLDNASIGRLAAEHLLTRGFENAAFFKFTSAMDVRERCDAFRRAVEEGGAAFHLLDWSEASRACLCGGRQARRAAEGGEANWFEWLAGRLRALPVPLGVMAQSDNRAAGVLSACEAVGLSVPEQVAVIGVDNDELVCEFAPVQISSVDSDREALAYEGAALLDRLMRGERPPRKTKRIPPKGLVVRASSDILAIRHLEVATALRFIWDHFREPIGVDDVHAATTMSRCGLYRAFQRHVGRTIGEELARRRIEHAKELLAGTDEKIHRVGLMSGFSGGEHLCRAFTRAVGMNPRDYRRRHGPTRGEGHPGRGRSSARTRTKAGRTSAPKRRSR
jgi:LacI family transcriptional regulator